MQVKGKLQSLQRDYEKQYNELIEKRWVDSILTLLTTMFFRVVTVFAVSAVKSL
jgi:hypothetical protein